MRSAVTLSVPFLISLGQLVYPPPFPRRGATKLLENDRVVVWDVRWEKGRQTPMHQHRLQAVSVTLVPGRVKSILPGGGGNFRVGPLEEVGDVQYGGGTGLVHREEGVSDTPRRVILVELKDGRKGEKPPDRPEGVPLAWPRAGAEKVLDNDRIVVWDYQFREKGAVPFHFHDKDAVVVELGTGRTRSIPREGEPSETEWVGNTARFAPMGRVHREEVLEGAPRAVVIELK